MERPEKRNCTGSEAEEDQRGRRVGEDGQETGRTRCNRRCQGTAAQEAGLCAGGGEKPTAEGTSALEDRGWVPSCCRACGRSGGIGGAEPKGMVSGRGAGVLKGQRRKARGSGLEPAGWRAGRGGPGSGSQGPMCPPPGSGEQSHNLRLPERWKEPCSACPRKHVYLPPCPRAQPEPTSLPPLGQGQRCLAEPGRSRSRNPERTHPTFPGLAPENCLSFPLALLAAITQETRAGPPISCELGGGLLGVVVLKKTVASEKKGAKFGTQPGRWVSS